MAGTDDTTVAEKMESAAAGYLATVAGLFRALAKLADDEMATDEVYAIAQAGTLCAERGLNDLDVLMRAHRAASAQIQPG